jgi:dynein heavy chain
MADIGFLGRIKNYDKKNIDPKIIEKVKKIVTDKSTFNVDIITKSNKAAGGLAKWCAALYRYAETLKIVQPIEANVKRMTEKYQAAMKEVEKKQAEVQSIREKLKAMED